MNPFQIDAVVGTDGKLELDVPYPAGTRVNIVVRDSDLVDEDSGEDVEWNDHLQARLEALDHAGVDPRPWREAVDSIRNRINARGSAK